MKQILSIIYKPVVFGLLFLLGNTMNSFGQIDTTNNKLPKMTLLNHKKIMGDLFGEPLLDVKKVSILVYDGFNTMEGIGAMVVFSELMNTDVEYVTLNKGWIKGDFAEIFVDKALDDIKKTDLLFIPGCTGEALESIISNADVIEWIKKMDNRSVITAGSGNGVYLLGKAGLLQGKNIASSWFFGKENATQFNANYQSDRYIQDGKLWTSASSTAVLDMCLALIKQINGETFLQAAMLDLEYDPHPHIIAGTEQTTSKSTVDLMQEHILQINGLKILDDEQMFNVSKNLIQQSVSATIDTIGILAYEGFFTLDVLGPLTTLSLLPNTTVILIGQGKKEVKSGRTIFKLNNDIASIKQLDMVLVPGGSSGTWAAAKDTAVINWLKLIDKNSTYTTSVCTGAWVLGESGLITNKNATTHWYRKNDMLNKYRANPQNIRYVQDGKYWTSAGVSAGIDFSFAIMNQISGTLFTEYAMLKMEYHPQSPINAGTPEKSNPLVVDMMMQMYDYMMYDMLFNDK